MYLQLSKLGRMMRDVFDHAKAAVVVLVIGQAVGYARCVLKDSTVANTAVYADDVPRPLHDAREVDKLGRSLGMPVLREGTPHGCKFFPILLCQQESLREHAMLQCIAIALALLVARIS